MNDDLDQIENQMCDTVIRESKQIIADMESRGFTMMVDGAKIRLGPASKLTSQDRLNLRTHRSTIYSILLLRRF